MPYQIKNGIVYGSNAVSLTQAQYDALSTAEKNNGTVYYIYDSDDAVFDAEDVGLADGGNVQTLAGSVAVIETSPATAIHAVGDYIVWNGQLYEVTTAIAVGETLTVGTNISATTVGEELTALNNGLTPLSEVVKTITVRSSAPITIQTGTFASLLFLGFAQGIGSVAITVKRGSSAVTAFDVTTGSSFSSEYLKFEHVPDGVRVTSTSGSPSTFTVVLGGA